MKHDTSRIVWIKSKDAQSSLGHYYMGKTTADDLDSVGEIVLTEAVQIREVQVAKGNQIVLDYMITADHLTSGAPITVYMSEASAICERPTKELIVNYEKAIQAYRASIAGIHLAPELNNGN